MNDISTTQFETIVTQRVIYRCLSASAKRNGFSYGELVAKSSYTGSEVLFDYGLGDDCRCGIRGTRVYLFHKKNRRIIAELGLAADKTANGLARRPQFYLVSRKGLIKPQSMKQLIGSVGRLDRYERKRRK